MPQRHSAIIVLWRRQGCGRIAQNHIADRVPLKMTAATELGDVAMDLTEYARP